MLQSDINLGVVARGPKGETGSVGPRGPIGPAGPAGSQGPAGIQGERGPAGPQGPAGKGFNVDKTYPSVAEMNAHFADDIKEGDMAMIASSVDDPDNAKLFIRSNDTMKFLADLSGAQGIKGEQGPAGPAGSQGDRGPAGDQGPAGERGPVGYTYQPYIADDGNWHAKLVNPDGSTN
ncbi:collagen-like protein [Limosilactobacillus vaginalis]|uniref:collagen-like protein n=1 Tax=Limosilactobacillus vaginalis TaxID=1633 RepID=UPI001DE16477|nr:collagen-like protein [Limosilactobacillus vaginalis]HJG17659.1 collagen-like protein [Limosilactobacillus vaginalis]